MTAETRPLWATMNQWQAGREARDEIKVRTAAAQTLHLRRFATYIGPDRDIATITRDDFELWVAHLRHTPNPKGGGQYTASTLKVIQSPVRCFFKDMHARGHIPVDPCAEVKAPRLHAPSPRSLPDETVQALFDACTNHRDRSILRFARYSGLRVSEVARVRVQHWDREAQQLVVTRSKPEREDRIWVVGILEDVLTEWVDIGLNGARSGPMWPSMKQPDQPMTKDAISAVCTKAAAAAGLEATFHQLRHTFCKNLVDSGVPMPTVQGLAGHVSYLSTVRYTTPNDTDKFLAMTNQDPVGAGSA